MLTQRNPRRCSAFSQLELATPSVTTPQGKESVTTGSCSSESLEASPVEIPSRLSKNADHQASLKQAISELRARIYQISENKALMEMKFGKNVAMLQNELQSLEAENRILKELAESARKDVRSMRNDIEFIRACLLSKEQSNLQHTEYSNSEKDTPSAQKLPARNRASKLFKPATLKIK